MTVNLIVLFAGVLCLAIFIFAGPISMRLRVSADLARAAALFGLGTGGIIASWPLSLGTLLAPAAVLILALNFLVRSLRSG